MVVHNTQTKEEIEAVLRQGECEVVFTKNDGTERQMVCTLHPRYLPVPEEADPSKPKKVRPPNPHVVACWDVEEEGWRSFRIDAIIDGPRLIG
jgi:hypothetical protein